MPTPTREQTIAALIKIVTMELPAGKTETDRRDKLAVICFMTAIHHGEKAWPKIWSEVMKSTGCPAWRDLMNKGKH